MKTKIVIFTAMAMGLSTAFADAGSRSDSASYSRSLAAAEAGAQSVSQGGNVTQVFTEPAFREIRNSGTTTIRSAPQVVAPSMSSGHPCAWAPLSVGISVVGFGGALGGQRIDDGCLLAQMGIRDAGMLMIAQRSESACQALMATGHVISCRGHRVATPVRYVAVGKGSGPRVQKIAYSTNRVAGGKSGRCQTVFATATTTKKVCY